MKHVATEVNTLPPLAQELYPELPHKRICDGKMIKLVNSKWEKLEDEMMASVLLTAVVRRGKWQPVPLSEIFELIDGCKEVKEKLPIEKVPDVLRKMGLHGEIELANWNSSYYVYPAILFADAVGAAIDSGGFEFLKIGLSA